MAAKKTRSGARRRGRTPSPNRPGPAAPSLESALIRIRDELSALGTQFALIGGLAVSARAEPRMTRDIDLVVAVASDSDAEELVRALRAQDYDLIGTLEQTATDRLASARFGVDPTGIVIDLLFASSGIENEIAGEAESLELLPGVSIPVARTGALIVLKLLARDDRTRPQDADDLRALMAEASSRELARARKLARLVVARGYGRGRNLPVLLDEAIASFSPG